MAKIQDRYKALEKVALAICLINGVSSLQKAASNSSRTLLPCWLLILFPVGSFHEEEQTWMWAWANGGVTGEINEKAETIKTLEDKTGNDVFVSETVTADEGTVWEIAAMACDHYQGHLTQLVQANHEVIMTDPPTIG